MSVVTNTILAYGCGERDGWREKHTPMLDAVNRFFEGSRGFVLANDVDNGGWYGGTKFLECNLAVGAFNYLDLDGLIAHIRSLEWEDPEAVQLIVKEQEDDRFRIIDVFAAAAERGRQP